MEMEQIGKRYLVQTQRSEIIQARKMQNKDEYGIFPLEKATKKIVSGCQRHHKTSNS